MILPMATGAERNTLVQLIYELNLIVGTPTEITDLDALCRRVHMVVVDTNCTRLTANATRYIIQQLSNPRIPGFAATLGPS